MNNDILLNNNHHWPSWQKIVFRLFFLFLTLEVLTDNFFALYFGDALMPIAKFTAKIYVPPCLWLNNHFFHFKHVPQYGFTFTYSLHAIRDIVYLLLAISGCFIWTILDRKRLNYRKLQYWFSQCLVIALACMLFSYGIVKVFPVQMRFPAVTDLHTPVGDLTPFELIWTAFGYGTPYQVFCGVCEVLAAGLILFKRTRVAGLLIACAIIINVIMVNYAYVIGIQVTGFYLLLITLFLLAPYAQPLFQFFFTKQPAEIIKNSFVPGKNIRTLLLRVLAILFVCISFILNTNVAVRVYTKRKTTDTSRQYSLVKHFVVNNDTLKLIENDTTCWRMWSERVTDGKRYVTIATMNSNADKTYTIEQDSLKQRLTLRPSGQEDTTALNFRYKYIDKNTWCLEGTMQQKNIHAELQKMNPDTTLNLLKTKRNLVVLDGE